VLAFFEHVIFVSWPELASAPRPSKPHTVHHFSAPHPSTPHTAREEEHVRGGAWGKIHPESTRNPPGIHPESFVVFSLFSWFTGGQAVWKSTLFSYIHDLVEVSLSRNHLEVDFVSLFT